MDRNELSSVQLSSAGTLDEGQLTQSDSIYLEQLEYLKEINDNQRLLNRTEVQLDRSCEAFQECTNLVERSKREMDILKEERKKLMQRIIEIDSDLEELSDVSASLIKEKSLQCSSAPLSEYYQLLKDTNSQRLVGQLPLLAETLAYSQLLKSKDTIKCPKGHNSRSSSINQIPLNSTQEVKAGRSQKLCPECLNQVSRNATLCPHCTSLCTKTSRPRRVHNKTYKK